MTLILGMSKADGIYMSVDYRVTDARTDRSLDDAAPKLLTVHFPPVNGGGPKALIGYTGVAVLPDGTRTGDWLRETLRGEVEVIDAAMAHLKARLNRDIASLGQPLMVSMLVLEPSARFFGGFSNLRRTAFNTMVVRRSFEYAMNKLDGPFMFAIGSGAFRIDERQSSLLRSQLDVWPRRPMDHMNLMASVNRKVASRENSVSPFCQVVFINADERSSPQSRRFVEGDESVPFDLPIIVGGVDVSFMAKQMHEQFRNSTPDRAQMPPDADLMDKNLKRRK